MDKKLIIVSAAIILLAAAFIYMSFSPNTAPIAQSDAPTDQTQIKRAGSPPPPPPTKTDRRRAAPPPPPPGLRKATKKAKKLPPGYINYEVVKRPEPIQKLKMGSTKLLTLDVKKGSEDYSIEWFKKGNGSLKKVNVGNTFSVSPEKTVVYYMATIDDKVNEPENIFFQVEPEEVNATAPIETAAARAKTTEALPEQAPITEAESAEETTEEPVIQEAPKEKYTISPKGNTTINAKAKTPLNIGYTVDGPQGYKVFWFHRPFNRKKSALIKKRTKLNFSLKRLNKYHSGYFYIQIKDATGKFYNAPEFKVTVK